MRFSWIAGLLLLGLVIAFRAISAAGYLPNFSPLPALILCSLVFLRGPRAWLLPMAGWVITDPLVSLMQGYPVIGNHHFGIAVGLSSSIGLAMTLRRQPSPGRVLGGATAAAVMFYFLTNCISFFGDPLYAKTLTGFVQAQWSGPEGFAPTWMFLRNGIAANLLFTAIFLAARPAWFPNGENAKFAPAETQ